MKTKFRFLPVFVSFLLLIGFTGCEKKTDDSVGKLTIALSSADELSTLKSGGQDSIPPNADTVDFRTFQLLISVKSANGEIVFEDKLIPIYGFGSGFVSEPIEIKAGEYNLTKFMVLNNLGQVIFAAPLEGSPRAYLVNRPLPLFFNINADRTTQITPEVLPVEGFSPSDFGYATFSVQIVQPVPFWVMAVIDDPILMRPAPAITNAELMISTQSGWFHNFKLEPQVNMLMIRSAKMFELVAFKEGYEKIKFTLTAEDVRATSKENPYVIKFGTVPVPPFQTLVLQPGPQDGIDARITNLEPQKNFGDYKYFESTFLSEPILTVMRSTRSLIKFNMGQLPKSATIQKVILTLHYEAPLYFDSLHIDGPNPSGEVRLGAALQNVMSPWSEYEVNWENQPKTTEMNQVIIYPFVKNANFIDVDVTPLYKMASSINALTYGIMMRQVPDNSFPGFRFASSDYPEPYMRPKLTIHYTLPA